ncbi:hypothetical protein ACLEDU_07110 [Lonsdalea quercina]|uniref:hypothetical protein n=1 Tax=Lonsdalea quercina TaxID=71657 RepID=UPI003976E3CA
MLPRLSVNDHRYVPSIVQLRKQARFLRDHCDIQLNYAYEMVAYFYRFSNWGDLINYIDSNIAIGNQRDVAQMRVVLQTYRSNLSANDLLQITQLKALPGTLTEAVENDRINVLNDLDILQFYNCLHDKEYWCEPVTVSWYKVLDETDRCLVLLAKRTALTWGSKTVNPHISFPWFGLKMYGYLYVNGNMLNYECRELDSYLWPSEKHYKRALSRSWFATYISGFIRTQLRSLCTSGFSGKISFSRVNSIDLIKGQIALPYLDEYDDEVTIAPINEIVKKLLDMGGARDTKKQKVTFTFGNGEVY